MISYKLLSFGCKAPSLRSKDIQLGFQSVGYEHYQWHFVMYLVDTYVCRQCCFCCYVPYYWETFKQGNWHFEFAYVLCVKLCDYKHYIWIDLGGQGMGLDTNKNNMIFQYE